MEADGIEEAGNDRWGDLVVPGLSKYYANQTIPDRQVFTKDYIAAAKIHAAGLEVIARHGEIELKRLEGMSKGKGKAISKEYVEESEEASDESEIEEVEEVEEEDPKGKKKAGGSKKKAKKN